MKISRLIVFFIIIQLLVLLSTAAGFYHPNNADKAPQPQRLIIKLKPETNLSLQTDKAGIMQTGLNELDRINRDYSIKIIEHWAANPNLETHPQFKNIFLIDIPENAEISAIQEAYRSLPEVIYCHEDVVMELYDRPDDPLYQYQWPLNNTGQEYYHILRRDGEYNDTLVWQTGIPDADIDAYETDPIPPENTSTVIVAVIDTGVDPNHPDLVGRLWTNQREIADNNLDDDNNGYIDDTWGWDFTGDASGMPPLPDTDPADEYGHGTHCAGIITANSNNSIGISGISPNCLIMSVKFYPVMLSSYAAEAIIYAADNGADIINMSFGYPWPVQILEDALEYARTRGVVLCAASGNDSEEFKNYPAAYQTVIAVAASTSADQIALFSTYGNHIDISAPGYSILSLRGQDTDMYGPFEPDVHIIDSLYYIASGTSMACPHVVGVAAFMRVLSPGLSMDEIQSIMENTADDIIDPYGNGDSLPGWDKYSGFGRVNLYSAIAQLPMRRAVILSPQPHEIVSGSLDIIGSCDGTDFINYQISYGSGFTPQEWTEILNSGVPVSADVLGTIDVSGLEGIYTFRISNSGTNFDQVTVFISNAQSVEIIYPQDGDTIVSFSEIIGSAYHPQFKSYSLEYRGAGSSQAGIGISNNTQPIYDDLLGQWTTSAIADGQYTLRLLLFTTDDLAISDSVNVYVQSPFAEGRGWRLQLDTTICNVPNWGDFDNDGAYEIIVGTTAGIEFYNPNGSLKTNGVPQLPSGDSRLTPAVGDLDGDLIDDFVAVIMEGDLGKLYGFPSQAVDFEIYLPEKPFMDRLDTDLEYIYPAIFLKDIDSDGQDEIFYYNKSVSYLYDSDGTYLFQIPQMNPIGNQHYLAADIDGDGFDEMYNSSPILYQFDRFGTLQNSYPFNDVYGSDFDSRSLSAVDIDHDGKLELIVFGRYFEAPYTYYIFAFDENLALKQGWPRNTGISYYLVPSSVQFVDIDNDSKLEYFISFFELTQGSIYAWNIDGSAYSGDSLFPYFAVTGNPGRLYNSLAGDLDGDGFVDIYSGILADMYGTYNVNRVEAWNLHGDMLAGWPLVTKSASQPTLNHGIHTPCIADLDQDGRIDLLMTTASNELVFLNISETPYNPANQSIPFWRYNRRMNSVRDISNAECGDLNRDGAINISDAIYLINYIFIPDSPKPIPPEAADINCDSKVSIVDIIWLVNYIFRGGYAPCDFNGDNIPDCL